MSSWTVLGGIISLMVLGCATDPSVATRETTQIERKERQQRREAESRLGRQHGRIGFVGNQAPALEGTTVPPKE